MKRISRKKIIISLCVLFLSLVFLLLFNNFITRSVMTLPPIRFDDFSRTKQCFYLICLAKYSCVKNHGFVIGMKKGSSLEGLEGELVSLGEQKLISSNNNLSLTNNSFVFSKQLLDSLDQDKEYYLTIRFERLELPVDYNHTIVLGYAIDKKSSSAEAMVVIPHSKKRSFYYDKNTIGPVLVRGPEVVHAAIQEIELSVLAKILESQGDHVPFGKHE